jgi:hypothetical protein
MSRGGYGYSPLWHARNRPWTLLSRFRSPHHRRVFKRYRHRPVPAADHLSVELRAIRHGKVAPLLDIEIAVEQPARCMGLHTANGNPTCAAPCFGGVDGFEVAGVGGLW